MKKVGIISQARMTSTRLPGKVLLPVGGRTVLDHHADRLAWSGLPLYIATTTNRTDDAITHWAEGRGLPFYCGSEDNVLSRYYGCALENKLDIIIRVTSDCPLIDGNLIRVAFDQYLATNDDSLYLSNGLQRTFPRGFDFEIFSFTALAEAFQNATAPEELEHVTPYIKWNKSGKVKVSHYVQQEDKSDYRITLDVEEDFVLIKKLIEQYDAAQLNYKQITTLLDAHPELVRINQHVQQKHG